MQNVKMTLDGDKLLVEIDLSKRLGESSTGKTIIVATTGGNVPVPDAAGVSIGINCYVKNPEYKK